MRQPNWNVEIRRRLAGCPRAVRAALAAERAELKKLYRPGRPCADVLSARIACYRFDRALAAQGKQLEIVGAGLRQ